MPTTNTKLVDGLACKRTSSPESLHVGSLPPDTILDENRNPHPPPPPPPLKQKKLLL